MDSHIFRYDSANQTISKFALAITIAAHSLTTRTLLYIRTHARARLQYPERHLCSLLSIPSWLVPRIKLYCASKALSCFVPMVKHHQDPHKRRAQTAHALRNHPRLMSQRDTRNKVLHVQKPVSSQTYSRINPLNLPIFVRFSA